MDKQEREQQQEEVWEMVKQIHTAIYVGNGRPSIMVRLDRLEQKGKIVWGAFVAVIGKVLHNSMG